MKAVFSIRNVLIFLGVALLVLGMVFYTSPVPFVVYHNPLR